MNAPTISEIESWFTYHPATEKTGPIHDRVRRGFRQLAETLIAELPAGPDRTVALRKLQDAMMSANACVAIDGGRQIAGLYADLTDAPRPRTPS